MRKVANRPCSSTLVKNPKKVLAVLVKSDYTEGNRKVYFTLREKERKEE